jgi:hypothetical protein
VGEMGEQHRIASLPYCLCAWNNQAEGLGYGSYNDYRAAAALYALIVTSQAQPVQ